MIASMGLLRRRRRRRNAECHHGAERGGDFHHVEEVLGPRQIGFELNDGRQDLFAEDVGSAALSLVRHQLRDGLRLEGRASAASAIVIRLMSWK
jgi:hypothetical protein